MGSLLNFIYEKSSDKHNGVLGKIIIEVQLLMK